MWNIKNNTKKNFLQTKPDSQTLKTNLWLPKEERG